jgi:hypothetical protein
MKICEFLCLLRDEIPYSTIIFLFLRHFFTESLLLSELLVLNLQDFVRIQ